jgi:uncharacterized membrane protein YkvA (DUF1232 family)
MMSVAVSALKQRARRLKSDTYAIYLAARHPRVPWYAKLVVACVVGYALSPVDLIPDFIPVLGYLDDLVLVPAGIALAIRLIPPDVMAECRARAEAAMGKRGPRNWVVGALIITLWLLMFVWVTFTVVKHFRA